MTHWFLSPHPDDAVLSCGGQIATLTRQGARVVIVTMFTGDPDPPRFEPSAFVEELWARWNIGRDEAVTQARRAEDQAAAAALGAEIVLWPWPEAIYRLHPTMSSILYPNVSAIFGELAVGDPALHEIIDGERPTLLAHKVQAGDSVHAPLGVGHHVDHQLAQILARIAFSARTDIALTYYDEYPYSADRVQIDAALARINTPETDYLPIDVTHALAPDALASKIAAIGCYTSQISTFWDSMESMANDVRSYTARVHGERERQLVLPEEFLKRYDRTTKS